MTDFTGKQDSSSGVAKQALPCVVDRAGDRSTRRQAGIDYQGRSKIT
jgi:hypothetical protein